MMEDGVHDTEVKKMFNMTLCLATWLAPLSLQSALDGHLPPSTLGSLLKAVFPG